MENWKTISAFPNYEVSSTGKVRNKKKGNILKPFLNSANYLRVRFQRPKNIFIHHLVAEAFIGERPQGLVIDHIDRNKHNNNVSNLRYVTFSENMRNKENRQNENK